MAQGVFKVIVKHNYFFKLQEINDLMDLFQALVEGSVKDNAHRKDLLELRAEIEYYLGRNEYATARFKCEDLISRIKSVSDDKLLLQSILNVTYSIRGGYMRKEEIKLGAFVNAEVEFVPKIVPCKGGKGFRGGDSGFRIHNERGEEYDCYIKGMPDLQVADRARLWITNIKWSFNKIYLEPRVEAGDIFFAKIKAISKRGEPFFRFLSYDGFVKIFDADYGGTRKLKKGRDYKMKAIYTRLSVRKNRIGILFAHALEKVSGQTWKDNQDKVLKFNQDT